MSAVLDQIGRPIGTVYDAGNARWHGAVGDGVADDTAAIQAAIDAAGSGDFHGKARIPAGVYRITESIIFGSLSPPSKSRPIIIEGDGQGTQIINACSAGKPTFATAASHHWQIRDLLLTGNSTHPNDGIKVNSAATFGIRWNISNVVSMMAGCGIVADSTNTGVIRDFKHWPDSNDYGPTVAPVVTMTDVGHGIYLTGGFAHDISVYDADCFPRDSFAVGACGIKCDATGPNYCIRIFGGLFQGNAGNGRNGILLTNCNSALIHGAYHESSVIRLDTATGCVVSGTGNGGVEGRIVLQFNSINNTVIGCNSADLDIANASCLENTIIGGAFTGTINDAASSTGYINVRGPSGTINDL